MVPETFSARLWRIWRSRLSGSTFSTTGRWRLCWVVRLTGACRGFRAQSFFSQAVVGVDAFDAALADREVGLAQFLDNDGRGGVGVQKTIAQDLTHHGVRAAREGFGAGFSGLERLGSALLKGVQELVIALPAVAVLGGDGDDVLVEAFAFHEHDETLGHLIGGGDRQGTDGSEELLADGIE